MKYVNIGIKKYLHDLAEDLPAPGGGSASSVTAALGVSLLLMVANFTKGREAYRNAQKTIQGVVKRLSIFEKELERLIDEDVRAYTGLSRCIKLPKTFAKRKERLTAALRYAAGVPLKICEISHAALESSLVLLRKGNKKLLTDVGCGAFFLASAFEAGRLNVEVNLKYIDDKRFTSEARKRLDAKGREVSSIKNIISRAMKKCLI